MKRSRGERDAPRTSRPTGQQRLYLIFDDCEWGYSIRELNLSNAGVEQRRLPPPFISLEAQRSSPQFFTAVGTKILATHPREDGQDFLPMIDVRSRGISFAPGQLDPRCPIYIPAGDKIFALDRDTFKMLSMKPLSPPRLEHDYNDQIGDWSINEWSWCDLTMPPFNRMDVTSYAVDSDGQTILASTRTATFAFNPMRNEWEMRADWSLPFSGCAYFVSDLDAFVGLPKDRTAFGHLCFCRCCGADMRSMGLSEDNLSNKGPAESHVGTTLVYLGESRFCIVECIINGDDKAVQEWMEERDRKELDHTEEEGCPLSEEGCPLSARCCLTTFSLISGTRGAPTVAETAVKCYKVPERASLYVNPVAFWL
nr:unnamed protein product [Digitaria exilis]